MAKPRRAWVWMLVNGIVVAILAVGLFVTPLLLGSATVLGIQIPRYLERARVTACRANLQELYRGFMLYRDRFRDWPHESGIGFFLELWRVETDMLTDDLFARRFTCPAVDLRRLPGIDARRPRDWFRVDAWARIDSTYTAYAGRDVARFPIDPSRAAEEALVSDDNEGAEDGGAPNHPHVTLVLMADGSVVELDHDELRARGVLGASAFPLAGPGSPIPELRTLSPRAIH